jgi:hypothetical protein
MERLALFEESSVGHQSVLLPNVNGANSGR